MIKFRPITHNVKEKFPGLKSYLEKDEDVLLAYLFGSFVAEKASTLSDIDIAILLNEGIDPLEKQLSLLADIASILKTDEIDLVILNHAPISLQHRVIRDGKLLISKDEKLRKNYHQKVSRSYLDFEFLCKEYQKQLFCRIKQGRNMIDKNLIASRLARLEKSILRLRQLASIPYEAFVQSEDLLAIAERNLQVAIQTCLDIGNHIISACGLGTPESYADIFKILAKANILPKEFAEKIKAVVGLRNILVHEYLEIDPSQIYYHLLKVSDFQEYARYITYFVEKQPE